VDDTLEVIKRGSVAQLLTDHLNSINSTGSIRFTYEQEGVLKTRDWKTRERIGYGKPPLNPKKTNTLPDVTLRRMTAAEFRSQNA